MENKISFKTNQRDQKYVVVGASVLNSKGETINLSIEKLGRGHYVFGDEGVKTNNLFDAVIGALRERGSHFQDGDIVEFRWPGYGTVPLVFRDGVPEQKERTIESLTASNFATANKPVAQNQASSIEPLIKAEYDALAEAWRTGMTIDNFLNSQITIGGKSSEGEGLRNSLLLTLAEHAAVQLAEGRDVQEQAKVIKLSEALRGFNLHVTQNANRTEDVLTLGVMNTIALLPWPKVLIPFLSQLKLVSKDSDVVSTCGWPFLDHDCHLALFKRLNADVPNRVIPDWLVETTNELAFFEFKAALPGPPNHGKARKVGDALIMGYSIARAGGKQFRYAMMVSKDGKVNLKGLRNIDWQDAVSIAVAEVATNEAKFETKDREALLASVVPFTWSDVSGAIDTVLGQNGSDLQVADTLSRLSDWLEGVLAPALAGRD